VKIGCVGVISETKCSSSVIITVIAFKKKYWKITATNTEKNIKKY
jgi:hypothetical protein